MKERGAHTSTTAPPAQPRVPGTAEKGRQHASIGRGGGCCRALLVVVATAAPALGQRTTLPLCGKGNFSLLYTVGGSGSWVRRKPSHSAGKRGNFSLISHSSYRWEDWEEMD